MRFNLTRLAQEAAVGMPVRLPIRALLLVPDDPNAKKAPIFNLPGAINLLMGSAGWSRASGVINPKVWAPGWTDRHLLEFVAAPFPGMKRAFPRVSASKLRAKRFPPMGTGPVDFNRDWPTYEIVHAVYSPEVDRAGSPVFRLSLKSGWVDRDDFVAGRVLSAGRLRDVLVAVQTRVLILQCTDSFGNARELAQMIVGAGGPATIVVSADSPLEIEAYLTNVYANIIHNQPLPSAAEPRAQAGQSVDPDVDVDVFIGEGGDTALQFSAWLRTLDGLIDRAKSANKDAARIFAGDRLRLLHQSQVDDLAVKVRAKLATLKGEENLVTDLTRLDHLRSNINFAHETDGVLPLSEISMAEPKLRATIAAFEDLHHSYPGIAAELEDEVKQMAHDAPRVLNANFADPERKRLLELNEPLAAGHSYDLLVDVGPRWNRVPTIVSGADAFPESSLPPDREGWTIQVVFFSEDLRGINEPPAPEPLSPQVDAGERSDLRRVDVPPLSPEPPTSFTADFRRPVASAAIWLPARSGRSFPIVAGKRAEQPGPVTLRTIAPAVPEGCSAIDGHGRLSLYFEGNLLQSAQVRVTVVRDAAQKALDEPNSIVVDYVLSGTLRDIDTYAARQLGESEKDRYPIALSIATNSDGAGEHRIMIADRAELTVSRPYDPEASKELLRVARSKLKECFSVRDENCRVPEAEASRQPGLDAQNRKSVRQFECDLFQLAWYGSDLFAHAFGQISSPTQLQYLSDVQKALSSRVVIQVARTKLAQYVYPWAMVYDIPLPNRNIPGKLRYCKVLDEWGSGNDVSNRTSGGASKCPAHKDTDYDLLCPYGFWGLKHYIEQPINLLPPQNDGNCVPTVVPDATSTINVAGPLSFGVALTRDAQLDASLIDAHFKAVSSLAAITPATGAADWSDVQAMLNQPDIAYFLCHGEFDSAANAPYLGVGPRDTDAAHRIYTQQLFDWARTQPNFWANRHPLIMINGCHTANLEPGQILSFVTTFANFGASAVVGTEIAIRLPLAAEVGEKFLRRVAAGDAIGAIMYDVRWDLANKGNLLGLAYTPYCLANLRFSSAAR